MDYKEALETVKKMKTADNYLLVKFDYREHLVLPYKDGLAFMASLINAEMLNEDYSDPKYIYPMDRTKFETSILSRKEYEQFKIANLLGVSIDEIKRLEKPEPLPPF
jgi:hypothetical protein